jgi:membrane protein
MERSTWLRVGRDALVKAGEDGVPRLAAGLAFFTVLALPGLLSIVVGIAGSLHDRPGVEARLLGEVGAAAGPETAKLAEGILRGAGGAGSGSPAGRALGMAGLVLGAVGAFLHLQDALNVVWGSGGRPRRKGVAAFLLKRLASLGLVLALALVALTSLLASSLVAAFGDRLVGRVVPGATAAVVEVANLVATAGLSTLLFAAIFRVLPDTRVDWCEVRVAAVATALLLLGGKSLLALYLAHASPGSAYGAAGPLVVLLVAIYAAANFVLIGAELSQAYACGRGPRCEELTSKAQESARRAA